MTDKYEMIKEYINELSEMKGYTDSGIKSVKEVIDELDKAESKQAQQREQEEQEKVLRADFEHMSYTDKVKLKQDNPQAYKNAVQGIFKGVK